MLRESESPPLCPGVAIGMQLTMSFAGSAACKSVLLGMEYGQCLIVKPPPMPDFPANLFQKNQTVVRYFHAGRAYGFRTTLIGLIKEPVRLLILSYPDIIESLNLRKNERYECQIPAYVILNLSDVQPDEWQGFITDISLDGCRFESRNLAGKKPVNVKVGDIVEISFHSSPENARRMLRSEIRIFTIDKDRLMLGLRYRPDADSQYQQNSMKAIEAILENMNNNITLADP